MQANETTESALRARFQTRVEWFEHGALSLEVLMPAAADLLIDEDEFEADERLPYWADLWPSARALARHLLDQPTPPGRVLELGCGVALPSLALLARGADVLATDYYADALRFAEANAARNGLPPLATAHLDWRAVPRAFAESDLVLAADVMYEQRNAETLAEVLPALVGAGGRVVIADPGRAYLGGFLTRMEASGWTARDRGVREEISDPATGAFSRVRIVELAVP